MRKAQPFKKLTAAPVAASEASPRSGVERWRSALFLGLLAIVVVAPAPLGSGRPLAWEILGLAVAMLTLGALFSGSWDREDVSKDIVAPTVLYGFVLVYAVLQCVPLPIGWGNPVWELASEGLQQPLRSAISIDPSTALTYVFRLLSYGGVFFLALLLGRERARAQTAITVIGFAGAIYAAYGLIAYWAGNTTILWLSKWAYLPDLTGTFVNRNSFATYLGLALLACLTDLIIAFEAVRFSDSKREQLSEVIERAGARAWQVVSLFILFTALLLTHSRGGLLSTLLGCVVLLLAMVFAPSLKNFRFLAWAAIPVGLVLAAMVINGDQTFERLTEIDSDSEGRSVIFAATWLAIKDFSLLGTGLGSFASIFQIYRPETIGGLVDLAHNDYLQNMLELGIPAALCLFAALLWLVVLCVRGILTRNRDAIFPCLGVAAAVLVGAHALVDFSLQLPAVTAIFLFLLGIAVAQSRSAGSN